MIIIVSTAICFQHECSSPPPPPLLLLLLLLLLTVIIFNIIINEWNQIMTKLYILFLGNLEDEEKVLAWLEHQVKSDEIEDITDEMLDMLIDKMPHVAVLFCECYFIDLGVKAMYCVSKCSDCIVCKFNSWIYKFPYLLSLQSTQMRHLFYLFCRKYGISGM